MASRNTVKSRSITAPGKALGVTPNDSLGSGGPPGSIYSATLTEWPNKAMSKGEEPDAGSANNGMIPPVNAGQRKTGRI